MKARTQELGLLRKARGHSWGFRLFRVDSRAFFPNHSDPAEDVVAISNFEDLPNLFRDGYSSASNHFRKERYLFLVQLDRHLLRHRR